MKPAGNDTGWSVSGEPLVRRNRLF